jgi:hypothetical protein
MVRVGGFDEDGAARVEQSDGLVCSLFNILACCVPGVFQRGISYDMGTLYTVSSSNLYKIRLHLSGQVRSCQAG